MQSLDLHRPIGEMFTDDAFRAFVYDFYHATSEGGDIPVIGDIYREIFSDEYRYREFLYYCKNHNFSFTHIEGGVSPELTLSLGILQRLRSVVAHQVQSLLNIPKKQIYEAMMQEKPIELGGVSKWQALQAAIYVGIPVNTRGEVVYLISKIPGGYMVYSDESGVHEVDSTGKILCDTQEAKEKMQREGEKIKNRAARKEILKTLQKFQRIQMLMHSQIIEDENDFLLATLVRQAFEKETGESWTSVEGNPKEENVYAMKFKSYIFFRILDLEKEYKGLQEEDNFAQQQIVLVGGTDMGD